MANDLNNGAEKLIGRILSDAGAEAERIAREAEAEREKIKELAQRSIQQAAVEFEGKAKKTAEGILERSRTNAELDSRKYALAAKRELIDSVFEKALEELCSLDGEKRDDLIKRRAAAAAYGKEVIRPAQDDVERIKALLPDINAELAAMGKDPVSVGDAAPGIKGGFLLIGDGYEINCSFEAMLKELREETESSVAKLLFE